MRIKTAFLLRNFLKFFPIFLLSIFSFATNATWYRYYDNRGISNISSTVSPEHLRYGYEVLDSNMQVTQRFRPATHQNSLKHEVQREQAYKQHMDDLRLKNAYSNSRLAEIKKTEALKSIQEQIVYQKNQSNLLYKLQFSLKQKEQEMLLKGQHIPTEFKVNLQKNTDQLNNVQKNIIDTQVKLQRTEQYYNTIINRLKFLESRPL